MLAVRKLPVLPRLPGVSALSLEEIRADLQDMVARHSTDTDSDSSILSDEVLISHYPVNPRRTLSIQRETAPQEQLPPPVFTPEIEEALRFLKEAPRVLPASLIEGEEQRVELESKYQAFTLAHQSEKKKYTAQRAQQEAYLRLLQLLLLHALKVRGLCARRAVLLRRLYALLVSTQRTSQALAASSASAPGNAPRNVFLLRVEGSAFRVLLRLGERICTPYGQAELTTLPQPGCATVALRLPYGTIHMSLSSLLACKLESEASEGLSLAALARLYAKSSSANPVLGLNSAQVADLDTLLKSAVLSAAASSAGIPSDASDEADEGDTQGDDDTMEEADGGSSSVPGSAIVGGDAPTAPHYVNPSLVGERPQVQALNAVMDAQTVPRAMEARLPTLLMPPPALPPASAALAVAGDYSPLYQQAQRGLVQLRDGRTLAVETQSLGRGVGFASEDSALLGVAHTYTELSRQRAHLIQQISRLRAQCALRSQEATAVRLNMFTRRVAHRNFMALHNVVVPSMPLAQQQQQKGKSTSAIAAALAFAQQLSLPQAHETDDVPMSDTRASRSRGKVTEESREDAKATAHAAAAAAASGQNNTSSKRARAAQLAVEAAQVVSERKRGRDEPPKSEEDDEELAAEEPGQTAVPAKRKSNKRRK